MDTKDQPSENLEKSIIGGAYISDILENNIKVGERFGASISREELAKLKTNDKGEAKISFFENSKKRADKKDPDLIITIGRKSNESRASIFLNKEEMLKENGEAYISFLVSDKKPENVKSATSRNMVVFSGKEEDGKRAILGSGWNETRTAAPTAKEQTEIEIKRILKKINNNVPSLPHINAIGIDDNNKFYQAKNDESKNLIWAKTDKKTQQYINEHFYKKDGDIMHMPGGVPENERNLYINMSEQKSKAINDILDNTDKPSENKKSSLSV